MFREMETSSYGISQIQFYILFILYALGGKATSNEISSYTARTANSISQLTKRMERSGLVKKYTTDASDKNHVVTRLTKKGRQLYLNLETRENAHKAISVLTLEQRKQLRSCLETLQNGVLSEIAKASNQIEWKKPPLPSELLARSRT